MIRRNTWIFILICSLTIGILSSCKDDVASAGASALLDEEGVIVCSDTLRNILSLTQEWNHDVFTTPDSFLLGECVSPKYGTVKADILTQFAAPLGVPYPKECELDSAELLLYYRTWHGDGEAPMGITAYELDSVLNYDTKYASNLDIRDFCQMKEPVFKHDYILAPAHCPDSMLYQSSNSFFHIVKCPLKKALAEKIFAIRDYKTQEDFNRQFKGLYITTHFGSSSALYLIDIAINLHYHYSFATSDSTKGTLSDSRIFYANSEVRQVNRYAYPDQDEVRQRLRNTSDTNYILTPANLYTRLSFPMKAMTDSMQAHVGDKRAYVNMATLSVDVLNCANNAMEQKLQDWAKPATTMMLIKESAYERFFQKNEIPNDTCALCCDMMISVDKDNHYRNFFSFDLSSIFAAHLRDTTAADTLQMLLIPVQMEYSQSSSSYTISKVKLLQSISATEIRSSMNKDYPMDIEVIYSGFSDVRITR